MEIAKKIFRERVNGLLLIFLAIFIVSGFLLNSHFAQSKNNQSNAAPVETQMDEQVLGETTENIEEINEIKEEESPKTDMSAEASQTQENITNDKNINPTSEDIAYEGLRDHLKKYCGKNFNVKKCSDYLVEAKDARSKGARFKELYKKYHFESKKEEKKDSEPNTAPAENKAELVITSSGSSQTYKIAVPDGLSVLGLMDLLQNDSGQNFSYHSASGFVDKINGTENSGNFSWMLYSCKNGECKLSSVGAQDCKIADWDKIEWRYLDWTSMDWSTW